MQPVFLIQSVFSNASMLADNSLDPTSAASDQVLYVSLRNVSPNGVDALWQVMGGCRHMFHHIDLWGDVAPYMFYNVHVWRHARPRQDINAGIPQEGGGKPGSVRWALSCWKMGLSAKACPSMCGSSQGTSTSSWCLATVMLPWRSTNGSLQWNDTQPHTATDTLPQHAVSNTHARL